MSKFNSSDLYFDVNKFGDKVNIQKAYPELLAYKELKNIGSDNLKVAILFTDIGSPFVKIKDLVQKTEEVFSALGYSKTGKQKELYLDIIKYRQSGFIDACCFLIEYYNNHEFAAWYEKNRIYYEVSKVIAIPLNPDATDYEKQLDRKVSLLDKQKGMLSDLKELEINLFGSTAMKADAIYKSKKAKIYNWNERFADKNQVE